MRFAAMRLTATLLSGRILHEVGVFFWQHLLNKSCMLHGVKTCWETCWETCRNLRAEAVWVETWKGGFGFQWFSDGLCGWVHPLTWTILKENWVMLTMSRRRWTTGLSCWIAFQRLVAPVAIESYSWFSVSFFSLGMKVEDKESNVALDICRCKQTPF